MRGAWQLAALLVAALLGCAAEEVRPEEPAAAALVPCPRSVSSVYALPAPKPAPTGTGARSSEVLSAANGEKTPAPRPHDRKAYKPRTTPAAHGPNCGGRDNPCPLDSWMRANMAPALAGKNADALGAALERTATFSPDTTWQWGAMAKDAAAAAWAGDVEGAKKSCNGCHSAYKALYKSKFRARPVG